jgi:hypothetical protein
VTVFNAELFLAQTSDNDRPFFKRLIESQNFEMFIENRIAAYLEMKGEHGGIAILIEPPPSPRGMRKTKSVDLGTNLQPVGS